MHFAADRQIYAEGDEARCFYKVVSGVVRTCRFLSDGRRQIDAFHTRRRRVRVRGGRRPSAWRPKRCPTAPSSPIAAAGWRRWLRRTTGWASWFFSHVMNCLAPRAGTFAAAGARQRGAEDLSLPAGGRGSRRRRRVGRSGHEPAGYRRLPWPDDRDGVARPCRSWNATARIGLPSARRVCAEGSADAAGAECLRRRSQGGATTEDQLSRL